MLTELLAHFGSQPGAMGPARDPSQHRTRVWAHEVVCAIGGHDYVRHVMGNRIFLECARCGHQTPGWRIEVKPNRAH